MAISIDTLVQQAEQKVVELDTLLGEAYTTYALLQQPGILSTLELVLFKGRYSYEVIIEKFEYVPADLVNIPNSDLIQLKLEYGIFLELKEQVSDINALLNTLGEAGVFCKIDLDVSGWSVLTTDITENAINLDVLGQTFDFG